MKNVNVRVCQGGIVLLFLAFSFTVAMGAKDPALNAKIEEIQKITGEMAKGHQVMIVHMNRSQQAAGISNSRKEGDKARQGGKDLVSTGKKALGILEKIIESPTASRPLRKLTEEAICFLRASIHNAHEGMIHTHHIHMVSGLRGGVGHVKDGVNHARVSAKMRVDAEEMFDKMLVESGDPDLEPYVVMPTKYCGFGEHANLNNVLLDTGEPEDFLLEGGKLGGGEHDHDMADDMSHGHE
tara:strand:- start:3729 stop:4448 length:720 start_codon:yes stop_codon:yes gene_type:complete